MFSFFDSTTFLIIVSLVMIGAIAYRQWLNRKEK
jgi:hypothetical protein